LRRDNYHDVRVPHSDASKGKPMPLMSDQANSGEVTCRQTDVRQSATCQSIGALGAVARESAVRWAPTHHRAEDAHRAAEGGGEAVQRAARGRPDAVVDHQRARSAEHLDEAALDAPGASSLNTPHSTLYFKRE
jgi:hypothetical protein